MLKNFRIMVALAFALCAFAAAPAFGLILESCDNSVCSLSCSNVTLVNGQCSPLSSATSRIVTCPSGASTTGVYAIYANTGCSGSSFASRSFTPGTCSVVNFMHFRVYCNDEPPAPTPIPAPSATPSPGGTPTSIPVAPGSLELCTALNCRDCHSVPEGAGVCVGAEGSSFKYSCPATAGGDVFFYGYSSNDCTTGAASPRNIGKPGTCSNVNGGFSVRVTCSATAIFARASLAALAMAFVFFA